MGRAAELGTDGRALRERLAAARLYLLFTPGLCAGNDPLAVLAAALPHVDLVQVRIKDGAAPAPARELALWTERVLELARTSGVPVLVNDRPDVARSLLERGCAGVHLGQDDCPPRVARELLGQDALVGLSTHDTAQVALALDEPVDYFGFGPVHATATKGYTHGVGAAAAWVAHLAAHVPLFPLGGIDATNANELAEIGRAGVSAAILTADDPAAAARTLRGLLSSPET
jgi:thiamine-phosphate diphosphorylase